MLNEVWLVSITSFSNVPYWSICYEWGGYVTVALVCFFPLRFGIPQALVTALIIEQKLICLAPIWWVGVLLNCWRRLQDLSVGCSGALMLISVIGVVTYHVSGLSEIAPTALKDLLGEDLHRSLAFSKLLLGDDLLRIVVFTNCAGARNVLGLYGQFLLNVEKPV